MLLAVVFVFVTFSDAFLFQREELRLALCSKENEVLEFVGHG